MYIIEHTNLIEEEEEKFKTRNIKNKENEGVNLKNSSSAKKEIERKNKMSETRITRREKK